MVPRQRLLASAIILLTIFTSALLWLRIQRAGSVAVATPEIRVAFYTIGLGKGYFLLALQLVKSATENFCANKSVHIDYYIFSNHEIPQNSQSNLHIIPKVKRGWPSDSLDRFKWIHEHASQHRNYDYVLWMDADQRFERPICYDVLGELVAVAHPHYYDGQRGYPYETRLQSKAFVPAYNSRIQNYFSAHIFGGTHSKILSATKVMNDWLDEDLSKDIHARVDDESYLNAYFYHNFPTVVLSRIFVWPEGGEIKYQEILRRHGGRGSAAAVARHIIGKPRTDP